MMIRSRMIDPSYAEKAAAVARSKAKELEDTHQRTRAITNSVAIITCNDLQSVEELLGKGGFNSVSQVVYKEKKFAMKYLRNCVMADQESFLKGAEDLCAETHILSRLQHENIVKLHATSDLSTAYTDGTPYFLIMDRLYGTVEEQIRKWRWQEEHSNNAFQKKGRVERKKRLYERLENVVLPIARAMEYLHSHKVMFRDLKAANVGFTARNHHESSVKLFDFGLARFVLVEEKDRALTIMTGSPLYMAPEVIIGNYTFSADVYSFGMFLWEVASLLVPFEGWTVQQHYEQAVVGTLRPPMDNNKIPTTKIQKMIRQCWDPEPSVRPCFHEIPTRLEEEVRRKQSKKRRFLMKSRPEPAAVVVKAAAA